MKLVIASGNAGKLREIEPLLAPLGFELVPQSKLGIAEADEPHDSFVENALAKARHAAAASRHAALADDSGLCVPALGGVPGVHSAYYAGREGDRQARDARNNAKLLASLGNERDAYYVCVIVVVRTADDARPLVAEGRWHGRIATAPRGDGGFGYDPLFYLPALDRTAAELAPAEKNRVSHRAQALAKITVLLKDARLA